jgi:hypothetical protein
LGRRLKSLVSLLMLGMTSLVQAESLPVRDLNPMLSGYELPSALSAVHFNNTAITTEFAISNISLSQSSQQDFVQLDAELQRWQFSYSKPLNERLSLRVDLPYVSLSGGHLDNFIESFHHIFGLPNGNRGGWPSNRLLVQHQHLGKVDYQLIDGTHGIGDLAVRLGWNFGASQKINQSLWVSLKFPTGDASALTGSGATDAALSYAASEQLTARIVSQQQLSLSVLGKGERIQAQQQTVVWSGSASVDALLTSHWSVALQFDAHTRVFDTGVRALGNALQFSFGPRYQSRAWQASLSLSEDIAVDTAPDIQFQLDIQRRF